MDNTTLPPQVINGKVIEERVKSITTAAPLNWAKPAPPSDGVESSAAPMWQDRVNEDSGNADDMGGDDLQFQRLRPLSKRSINVGEAPLKPTEVPLGRTLGLSINKNEDTDSEPGSDDDDEPLIPRAPPKKPVVGAGSKPPTKPKRQ